MRLINYLKKHKLSQAKFAKEVGIHRNHLHWIVHGKGNPSLPLALRICKASNGEVGIVDLISDHAEFALELENDEVKINFDCFDSSTQVNPGFENEWTL